MRNTIKATKGYRVCNGTLKSDLVFKGVYYKRFADDGKTPRRYRFISDGEDLLVICTRRKWRDYVDEVVAGSNECARCAEVFTDVLGRQWIYWIDLETDDDYVTLVPEDKVIVEEDLRKGREQRLKDIDW